MSFPQAISSGLRNYIRCRGRASRSEYWFWVLFVFLGSIAAGIIDSLGTAGVLFVLFYLGTLLPTLAVGVRRLHDTDRTDWWLLLGAIPVIGPIILTVWFVMPSTAGDNRFGAPP